MTIGQRIRAAREQANLTLDEVAKRCNTTKQTIFKYENEIVTNIPYDKIVLLSSALSVSPSYLFGWDEENKNPDQVVLTGVDKELYELLKLIPEEQKKLFLEMGRVFVNNLNKG
jgi:transcriptional regulator with XRE-family HTH domain